MNKENATPKETKDQTENAIELTAEELEQVSGGPTAVEMPNVLGKIYLKW